MILVGKEDFFFYCDKGHFGFSEWPLSLGNQWVYLSTVYAGESKSKYQVIDTVSEVINNEGEFSVTMD